MDILIYNTLNGNYRSIESLTPQMKENILSSPFFMVNDSQEIHLSPVALNLLSLHLYSLESHNQIIRHLISNDLSGIIAQSLKINDAILKQDIAHQIVTILANMGVTKEAIVKFVDNSIEKKPVAANPYSFTSNIPDGKQDVDSITPTKYSANETTDMPKSIDSSSEVTNKDLWKKIID